jgi:hypothetical protein
MAADKEPKFSEMFITHLLGRSIRVEADLIDQLFNSSETRLARMLLMLANFGPDTKPEPIIAKIGRGGPVFRNRMAAWLRWILGWIMPPISPRSPA